MTDTTGVTQYNYDVLDRLSSVTYPGAPLTTAYSYDGVGNRLTQQVDANPATVYTYDEADQLTAIDGVSNTFDENGGMRTIGPGGSLPDTFLYDQQDRLFRQGPCRSDVNDDGKTNSTDQLIISQRRSANEGTTSYDLQVEITGDLKINSGDLLVQGQENGKNCKSTGPNTGNGRSWYDGDGLRVRQRTFTATSPSVVNDDYTWDAGAELPVVLQDKRTPQGGVAATTTYLYGLGLISETSDSGVTSYYLADGLGSTTQLTDSAGAITDSYSYDVFGAPRTTTGTTANSFQYTAQQRDGSANRGLYFLRARSYDPALGRFLQKDPLPFGNRYSYAGNNAANYADPAGLWCPGCGFVSDKGADIKDWGTDVFNHPGSVIQVTAGTTVALASTGDRSRSNGVTFYENCSGACSLIRRFTHQDAITIGHTIFGRGGLQGDLLAHELVHVRQGDNLGFKWPFAYFTEEFRNGYGCNRFEEEARRNSGEASQCSASAGKE